MASRKPVIFGFSGPKLTPEEIIFFEKHKPFGYIVFARNIENPKQLKDLTDELKELSGNDTIPILIDQEGGRVARLKGPHWPEFPACGKYELMPNSEKEAFENGKKIGQMLAEVGINVNCAPMLDVRQKRAHDIVGDRAFSEDGKLVAHLGRAYMKGLQAAGVDPIIKHIPGHGRAECDSHDDLPIVKATMQELEIDFFPFRELKDAPYAMTAHIIYTAIDEEEPATMSPLVVDVIRRNIGFKNLLMTDDLSMKALKGSFKERTLKSLRAGCDLILHCNGNMKEMTEIANSLTQVEDSSF